MFSDSSLSLKLKVLGVLDLRFGGLGLHTQSLRFRVQGLAFRLSVTGRGVQVSELPA